MTRLRALAFSAWVLLILALAACSTTTSRFLILQNPTTRQTVECKIDPLGDMRFHKQIEDCVSAYKQASYVVVGDSDR
jgi:hypothetical protein